MTLPVLMIAFWQAFAVYCLCLVANNRGYAVLIGLAGAVVVSITGGNRYDGLDLLFVVVATLAAIWKITPYEEGETRGEVLAFAGKAVDVVVLLIVCGVAGLWYYNSKPVPAPRVAHQAAPVDVFPSASANDVSAFSAPASTVRRPAPSDKRHCLKFRDSAAVARCAGE